MKWDAYSRVARYLPTLMILSPASFVLYALSLRPTSLWAGIGLAGAASLLWAIPGNYVRDRGVRAQERLFEQWEGAPTTRGLRWRDGSNRERTAERHRAVSVATGISLPSEAEEKADTAAADHRYEVAVDVLRQRASDGLVLEENRWYGFRRNLYGSKSVGMVLCTITAIGCGLEAYFSHRAGRPMNLWATASGASVIVFLLWLTVTPRWVRLAAERYANQLLTRASVLPTEPPTV